MPRTARVHAPGCLVHLVSRFVDGRFLLEDDDRAFYLDALDRVLPYTDWKLISYALMSSHIHLGLIAGEVPVSAWIKPVHERFSLELNRKLRSANPKTLGHVFADRPKTLISNPSRAPFLIAYHHNNPVRAGVVGEPRESTWTSHLAYLGMAAQRRCLDVELGLCLSGFGEEPGGARLFHEFVVSVPFADRCSDPSGDPIGPHDAPRCLDSRAQRPTAAEVVSRVCRELAITSNDVGGSFRDAKAIEARRSALETWRELGGTMAAMAAELRISRSAASKILKRSDDRAAVSRRSRALARELAGNDRPGENERSVPHDSSEG